MSCHPWHCKYCIAVWVHRSDRDESLDTVTIQCQASIHHQCRHFCLNSFLLPSFVAALWCYRCELKMNPHPRHKHYDAVACSRWKPKGNIQCCVDYWVSMGMRGVGLCKSHDIVRVQDAGSLLIMGGTENGGVSGKMGYIYSSSCDFFGRLILLLNKYKTAQRSSCTATMYLMIQKPWEEIEYLLRERFTRRGVACASDTTCMAQMPYISQQIKLLSGFPNWTTIHHGYQHT